MRSPRSAHAQSYSACMRKERLCCVQRVHEQGTVGLHTQCSVIAVRDLESWQAHETFKPVTDSPTIPCQCTAAELLCSASMSSADVFGSSLVRHHHDASYRMLHSAQKTAGCQLGTSRGSRPRTYQYAHGSTVVLAIDGPQGAAAHTHVSPQVKLDAGRHQRAHGMGGAGGRAQQLSGLPLMPPCPPGHAVHCSKLR